MGPRAPNRLVAVVAAALCALAIYMSWGGPEPEPPAAPPPPPEERPAVVVPAPTLAPPPRAAETYRQEMTVSARRVFGPDAPVATLAAQIHTESSWNADARSRAGALGLAQFMPGTAEDMARRFPADCAPANPFSSRWAVNCRDRYMSSLLKQTTPMASGMSEQSHWAFALRAYNGGAVRPDRELAASMGANPDNWVEVQPFNGRRRSAANFKENTEYPVKIFWTQQRYSHWGRTIEEVGR